MCKITKIEALSVLAFGQTELMWALHVHTQYANSCCTPIYGRQTSCQRQSQVTKPYMTCNSLLIVFCSGNWPSNSPFLKISRGHHPCVY